MGALVRSAPRRLLCLAAAAALARCCGLPGFCTQPAARRSPAAEPQPKGAQRSPALHGAEDAAPWSTRAPQRQGAAVAAAGAALALLLAGARRGARGGRRAAARVTRRALTAEEDLNLETLLKKYQDAIQAIRKGCAEELEGAEDEYILRFAIEHKGDVVAAAKNVKEVAAWRKGDGKAIVESAGKAVAEATAGGAWDNAPVFAAAPHSTVISKYLTASQIVVVCLSDGDLCSCIRASAIDDKGLMDAVTVDQLVEFFLYAREVNSLVAQKRSRDSGRLVRLLAANDLTGVSKFPDSRFQEALTGSSKKATTLYPGLSGPTVILNLPGIVRLLVTFLTPLFPGAVQQKLKFARGPMAYLKDLTDVLREPTKSMFVSDLEAVLKS